MSGYSAKRGTDPRRYAGYSASRPTLAEIGLATYGAAAQVIYEMAPHGVSRSGTLIDSYLDLSGNGRDATAAGLARSTYDPYLYLGRPGARFSGAQVHVSPAFDMGGFDTLALTVFARDASNALMVLAQRSPVLAASAGGFQLSLNNPGAWANTWAGYKTNYTLVPSAQLEAYDLDPPAVITGLWDQTRTIWETDIRYDVAEVSYNAGRINTDTVGGFGNYEVSVGATPVGGLPFTGDFFFYILGGWVGGATPAVINQIVTMETAIKTQYA